MAMARDDRFSRGPRLTVDTQVIEGRAIVALGGELDITAVRELEPVLIAHEAAKRDVELDLSGLTYLDTWGLTLLFQSAQRARRGGWKLTVAAVSSEVRQLPQLTGLDVVLGLDDPGST